MSTSCLHVFFCREYILSQRQESLLINARPSSCTKACPLHSDVSAFQLIPINVPVCLDFFFSFMHHFFLPSPCSPWLFHFPDPFYFKTSFLVRLAFLKLLTLFFQMFKMLSKAKPKQRPSLSHQRSLHTLSLISWAPLSCLTRSFFNCFGSFRELTLIKLLSLPLLENCSF